MRTSLLQLKGLLTSKTAQISCSVRTGTFSRRKPGSSGAVRRKWSGGWAFDGDRCRAYCQILCHMRCLCDRCSRMLQNNALVLLKHLDSANENVISSVHRAVNGCKKLTNRSTQLPVPYDMRCIPAIGSSRFMDDWSTTTSIARILVWLMITPG